ncbi:MAG TPA: rod shape-determining protein RodA [Candidatus Limnocylindria bacterium]|nr:rod shape-determining protein RodA [Candidatus Limnocylindria bacterium]
MGALRVSERHDGVAAWASRPSSANWQAFDLQLVFYALALGIIGLLTAWTNSAGSPLEVGSVFTRGLMWLAVAMLAFVGATALDVRWLRTFAWLIYFVNIGLLLLTLAVGSGVGGVASWVSLFGLQFQFSELAKILMIAVLAAFFAGRQEEMGNLSTMVGAALLMAPPFVLVMVQPDLGTALVFGAIVLGMLFMSGASLRWLGVAIVGSLAMLPVIWSLLKDFQQRRLLSFLDPTADPQGSGWQVIQSQIAVGSGGLFGKGLTNATHGTTEYLPVATTDFAMAVLLEELGFVGGVVVLVLFVGLLWRVLRIGWRADDLFGVAFAAGFASMILFHMLVNIGMVSGIMPVTGIPLPFITHGGASLVSIALGLGILQSINLRRGRPQWSRGSD